MLTRRVNLWLVPGVWLAAAFAVDPAWAQERCENPIGAVVSVQGTMEIHDAESRTGRRLGLDDAVCPNDRIQVGASSRAVLALANGEILNLDQNTTVFLPEVSVSEPSLLNLVRGMVRFFSNEPRSFDITTPFMNAGVRGTEFLVRVDDDGTYLLVYEGRVTAANPEGQVELAANQAAFARTGAAPLIQVPIAPLDAVRWTIYYLPILSDLATGTGPVSAELPAALQEAIQLQRQGRIAEAVNLLESAAQANGDPRLRIYRAGLLLSVGRIDEAQGAIEQVLARMPDSGEALALRAVIAVARNDRVRALDDARRAVASSPQSSAARIALSYALQASFELEEARDVLLQAVERQPEDALAWARLAELWLALGYRDRALRAAERAAALTPDLGWTQLVLGYAALAGMSTRDAKTAFERAIALESHNPLAHLGLGLTIIRQGDLGAGRRRMEIATGLDPTNALVRSYLGKAYFEERRNEPAAEQLAFAKQADPADPTPWFYDAIRKQTENRPVEALSDLERAIALNDNRAVYRSRLLLDEDLAVRNVSLGRIFSDLGFEQRALVEASKSLTLDPANASAHRFLSDAYADRPRHEIARVSELLQAQLLQPLNVNPIQPRLPYTDLNIITGLGPAQAAFNEFTPLFARDRLQFTATGILGNHQTLGNEAVLSGQAGRLAFSAGQFHYQTDGFRENNDLRHNIFNLFAQAALTDKVDAQIELRRRRTDQGDLSLGFDPDFSRTLRREIDQDTARAGLHVAPLPNLDLIGAVTYSDRSTSFNVADAIPIRSLADIEGLDGQIQALYQGRGFTVTAGAGAYSADEERSTEFTLPGGIPLQQAGEVTTRQRNAYVYGNAALPGNTFWTLGLSFDDFDEPAFSRRRLNPKLGVQWSPTDWLRIRGAYFKTVKRALIVNQTLEPTQIAGFNQFFDDVNGSTTTRYGIGADVRLTAQVYGGAELSRRDIDVPAVGSDLRELIGTERHEEILSRGYLYWAVNANWALSSEIEFSKLSRERRVPIIAAPRELETIRLPVQANYFSDSGLFATIGATYVRQQVQPGEVVTFDQTQENFIVADAAIGYRLPNRRGIASLEVNNIFDQRMLYQDVNFLSSEPVIDPRFIPSRTVLVRLTLSF